MTKMFKLLILCYFIWDVSFLELGFRKPLFRKLVIRDYGALDESFRKVSLQDHNQNEHNYVNISNQVTWKKINQFRL